ncbi:MAG TPA: vitamin B12 dependent-methionine synthase activation domain-containing protein [Spirochaetota bacterium]|nr:vitamin B12 dependent-methionine synthase activation domain-containing protein [Spirochaetota bacterium]
MPVTEIKNMPVKISDDQVMEHLQYNTRHDISARIRSHIGRAVNEINELIEPQAVYRILPVDDGAVIDRDRGQLDFNSKNLGKMISDCSSAAVFLTTLGSQVDQAVQSNINTCSHYGYVLNEAAACAVEQTADYLRKSVNKKLPANEHTTYRYSPGYCDWHLSEQKKLFDIIPSQKLGVELSEHCLMNPSKSVSGIMGIYSSKKKEEILRSICKNCSKKNCPYRRI